MSRLLAISSSPNPAGSKTKALIDQFIQDWSAKDPKAEVTTRDLGTNPPPHLDGQTIGAFYTPAEDLSDTQKTQLAYSDTVIAELQEADVILIGAPMHNFGIPSSLKAWIDHVARVGKTFKYGDNGPVGLLKDKKVFILAARGGDYSENSPAHPMDQITPYLKTVLGFIGLTDVTFINAEGVAMGEDGLVAARNKVSERVLETAPKKAA